jgi:hypothetical protein
MPNNVTCIVTRFILSYKLVKLFKKKKKGNKTVQNRET